MADDSSETEMLSPNAIAPIATPQPPRASSNAYSAEEEPDKSLKRFTKIFMYISYFHLVRF